MRYQKGDGKSIKIWESPWLKCSPGFKSTTRKAETCDLTWVGELIQADGKEWDKARVLEFFLSQEADWICQQPISQIGPEDRLIWNPTNNGQFSVKSAYELILLNKDSFANKAWGSSSSGREKQMRNRTWKLNI